MGGYGIILETLGIPRIACPWPVIRPSTSPLHIILGRLLIYHSVPLKSLTEQTCTPIVQ
jgi:hypothetical protein